LLPALCITTEDPKDSSEWTRTAKEERVVKDEEDRIVVGF
jgi:hypothetical protein